MNLPIVQLLNVGAAYISKYDGDQLLQLLYKGTVTVTFPNEPAVRDGPDSHAAWMPSMPIAALGCGAGLESSACHDGGQLAALVCCNCTDPGGLTTPSPRALSQPSSEFFSTDPHPTPDARVMRPQFSLENDSAGAASPFSSYGPAINLSFKPDISAPGSLIVRR